MASRPPDVRAPRLLHELAVSRGDGSYARLLARLAELDLLAIDDWLLASLTNTERRDLLEVIEDRRERASTLIASQLPPTAWHAAIGEPRARSGRQARPGQGVTASGSRPAPWKTPRTRSHRA